jgi:predicted RNA-binding Zn ribbon-like protein
MPEPEINFEEIDPTGDLEVLLEGVDEIPAPAAVEEPEDLKNASREDIIAKVKQEREELVRAKEAAGNQAAIAQALKDMRQPQQVVRQDMPQQGPQETEDAFKTRFNEQFYNDPYNTMMEFQKKKLAPEVQRIMASNMQLSRKLAALDPDRRETFVQYQAEIDDFVGRLEPSVKLYDADVYVKAHDAVIARHVNEIIDRKVREATSSKPAAAAGKPGFSEGGMAPRPSGPRQTIVLSRKEQDWAFARGMSKESMAAYLMRNPDRRMK